MKTRGILWISAGILIFALFSVWLRLPLVSGNIWMSPDETANIASAINFAETGKFGFSSELTEKYIWAHPRSFVYIPETKLVAPIGFLGMPVILSLIYKLFGLLGINFFAPLLALATLYPLWRILPKKWPKPAKLATLIIWMSFPTIILYANRGTFPQLTQLCLVIWTWFIITQTPNTEPRTPNKLITKTRTRYYDLINKLNLPIAGILSALALIIRPVEAIWIIPVLIFAFIMHGKRDVGRLALLFVVPFVLLLLIGAKLSAETYGKWFVSGYQIRPEAVQVTENVAEAETTQSEAVSFLDTLPFSFHPMHIWWNVKNYYFWMLLPWSVLMLGSLLIIYKEKLWKSKQLWSLLAIGWAIFAITVFYGNGIYQDHVRLNEISLGNSFLRYTLPISIAAAISAGFIFSRLWKHWSLKIFTLCITAAFASYGIWMAISGYDESLLFVEQELISYGQVREAALSDFPEEGIILSDRSDKIFFPALSSVSPMPTDEQIKDLLNDGYHLRVYLPTQDSTGLAKWDELGHPLVPVFTSGNQTLYNLY